MLESSSPGVPSGAGVVKKGGKVQRRQKLLAGLVLLGGTAVLGSYAWGLTAAGTGLAGVLWGELPPALLPAYQANMVLATAGFFAYSYFLLLAVDAEALRIGARFRFGLFFVLYTGILIPSALWMPLALAMVRQPANLLWWAIRAVLAVVGLSSLGLMAALLALEPRRPRWAYWLAVAGSVPFALQTMVLDALLWPAFFPVTG
jgi:hypothetical protein